MKLWPIRTAVLALVSLCVPACNTHKVELHKIVATHPQSRAVTLTQQYVGRIQSHRHIKVRALATGYLQEIPIKEGQLVKAGDLMFKIIPILYQKKLDAELAAAKLDAELAAAKRDAELADAKLPAELVEAKRTRAQARAQLAEAELNLATVKAPFDGIVDRLKHQRASRVEQGELLTTLSDNSIMWVYFNVPEARYLEFMANQDLHIDDLKIELVLANGNTFPHAGKIGAIEAEFNRENGNIPFRADFPNPERLLRHGQTGTVLISRVQHDAIVIPQRATFEVLNRRYVYVVDSKDVVHQREVFIQNELDDLYVIKKGVDTADKIVLDGILQVRDGEKVECEVQ